MRVINTDKTEKYKCTDLLRNIFSANVHLEDHFKWTALHHAANSGQLSVVRALIDAGAKINHESLTLATPLSRAIESSALDVVNYLIEKRANVRHENLTRMYFDLIHHNFEEKK
jgi:ankyrin repeat protein